MNIFLGKNVDVLEQMQAIVGVDLVITESRPDMSAMRSACKSSNIGLRVLGPHQQLADVLTNSADLVVIASFSTILTQDIISRCGLILNFHGGLIQTCRGRHPLPSAILNHHELMGITCHIIDSEKIDAGPTVAQIELPLDYDANFKRNDDQLLGQFPKLAAMVFKNYKKTGKVVAKPSVLEPGGYYPPVTHEEMQRIFAVSSLNDLFRTDP